MPEPVQRLKILKTHKLFIGGKFPRTESGRYLRACNVKTGEQIANYCHASKKDLRNAIVAARAAFPSWATAAAYLRGQILYRLAEMLESRDAALAEALAESTGVTADAARAEVSQAVDRVVQFAGWADKYQQWCSSVNPVTSPHFSFSVPEPSGVVVVFCPDEPSLLAAASLIGQVTLSGNAVVLVASERFPLPSIALAEAIATSDFPGGVVNILTGKRLELAPVVASHMDVNAIVDASGDTEISRCVEMGEAENLKRVSRLDLSREGWADEAAADPYRILDAVEIKTAWHPAGL